MFGTDSGSSGISRSNGGGGGGDFHNVQLPCIIGMSRPFLPSVVQGKIVSLWKKKMHVKIYNLMAEQAPPGSAYVS